MLCICTLCFAKAELTPVFRGRGSAGLLNEFGVVAIGFMSPQLDIDTQGHLSHRLHSRPDTNAQDGLAWLRLSYCSL